MTKKAVNGERSVRNDAREARLKAALKANIARRKAQAQARKPAAPNGQKD